MVKPIGKRQRQKMIDLINSAIKSATMKNCSLTLQGEHTMGNEEDTLKIREAVRLHHGTWIIQPLKDVLEILEGKPNTPALSTGENGV